nr:DUF1272 domain-containing protein [Gordonia sp. NB41Y]
MDLLLRMHLLHRLRGALDACPNCGGELVPRPRRTTGAAAIAARMPTRIARRFGRRRDR